MLLLERRHGTRSRYVNGCRCAACRSAQAKYSRDYRALPPKVPIPLTTVIFHASCDQIHIVIIPRRPVFPSNGALQSYIGSTRCGRLTLHVYRRER